MKKISVFLLSLVLVASLFVSCKKDKEEEEAASILPSRFSITIPGALNTSSITGKSASKSDITPLQGDDIYQHMRLFINAGSRAADFIADVIAAIRKNHINQAMTVNFTGEDGRTKKLVVVENPNFNGETWEFKLTLSDSDSIGMQIFWNRSPIKGIAIVRPYHCDRNQTENIYAKYQIEYDETGTNYDKEMKVSVAGLTEDTANVNRLNNMKMYVGKTGDELVIYGNSNHPTAAIIDPDHVGGREWAFVAKANEELNIGVAKVGLPLCALDSTENIFTDYSIENVLRGEIHIVWDGVLTPTQVDSICDDYLQNAEAPGYFNSGGFVSCGASVPVSGGFTNTFIDLSTLTPYKPSDINELIIDFDN